MTTSRRELSGAWTTLALDSMWLRMQPGNGADLPRNIVPLVVKWSCGNLLACEMGWNAKARRLFSGFKTPSCCQMDPIHTRAGDRLQGPTQVQHWEVVALPRKAHSEPGGLWVCLPSLCLIPLPSLPGQAWPQSKQELRRTW